MEGRDKHSEAKEVRTAQEDAFDVIKLAICESWREQPSALLQLSNS